MMPRIIASLITVFAGLTISWSQSNISYVLDASGDYSSQGSKSNISASGQPGGISVSDNGQVVNYAGFLNTFSLQPTLDTDSDGLGDEVDSDNDNDDLGDLAELLGTGFSQLQEPIRILPTPMATVWTMETNPFRVPIRQMPTPI